VQKKKQTKKKREESLDDFITHDVLCVVLCVVWLIKLSPPHTVFEHLTMLETELLFTASISSCSLQLLVPEKQWWRDDSIRMMFALWVRPHTEWGTSCVPECCTCTNKQTNIR